jgi:outer membrane protein assembly factor BamD
MISTLRRYGLFLAIGLAFAAGGAFMSGCSSSDIDENDPTALAKDAEDDIESSRYTLALEKPQKLKNEHPYAKQATDAQLRIADVYFLQENYAESAATYEAFKDLHPKHPKFGYAMFRIGLAHYNDIPSVHARDLSPAFKAEEGFNDYLFKFPNDEFSAEAKEKLAETRRILAEKEMYIANFYFKREMWEAAKGRYSKVVSQYSETPFVADAQERIKKIEALPPEEKEEEKGTDKK